LDIHVCIRARTPCCCQPKLASISFVVTERKAVQRDIGSRRVDASGESFELGRLARMHSVESIGRSGRRARRKSSRGGRHSTSSARRKLLIAWSVVLGVAALGVISVAISMWLWPQLQRKGDVVMTTPEMEDARVRVASRFVSPSEAEALRLVQSAVANRDASQVEQLFHLGVAAPAEVVDFCVAVEARDGPIERFDWLGSIDGHDLLVEGVLVVFKGVEKPLERLALLTPDLLGNWKVDFDAYARTVEPSWEVFLGKQDAVPCPPRAVVRVIVAKDSYFNGPFGDESEWACYGIASPDIDDLLHGYCRTGSAEQLALDQLFVDGEPVRRVTLELARVENADAKQFEITQILAKDWVVAKLDGSAP